MERSDAFVASRRKKTQKLWILALLALAISVDGSTPVAAASAEDLNAEGAAAVELLRENNLVADKLASTAKGILVFPDIVKAGFMFGGQIGEGVLMKGGRPAAYYNSVAASYGLQAGIQEFGYALFFMDDESLADFENSAGFEIGVGPSIVLVDEGVGRTMTNKTIQSGIYAFIFDQKGLMAGLGLQGSKITRISK
ncbi:MAG: twin-arginine translocation pathway signal protein [Deltaproteobacteria bacterium]|jgi:lipid-binding SYLF domain-containing protein|nr:twin-arginine translocation pathway signal protein [Deltaproteobacteria bacterium]